MIKILMGPKGTGKTKAFINMANSAVCDEMGTVVCITMNDRHLLDLKSKIRMVNTTEYSIDSYETLYGFICGIISGNYDIAEIFIDSITKIATTDFEKIDNMLIKFEEISNKFDVNFTVAISAENADATDTIKKYLIEI